MNPAETIATGMKDWTPRQKEQLLTALANELLKGADKPIVSLRNEANETVAYLLPAWDPAREYEFGFAVGHFLELLRRASTPEDAVSWSEFQSLLEADGAFESTK